MVKNGVHFVISGGQKYKILNFELNKYAKIQWPQKKNWREGGFLFSYIFDAIQSCNSKHQKLDMRILCESESASKSGVKHNSMKMGWSWIYN